jgi:hypothetical protein
VIRQIGPERAALSSRRGAARDDVELFFDLVFVFAITQLARLLKDDLSFAGAGRVLFLLLVLWWAWIYTTWMTNWFDAPGSHGRRRYRRRGLRAQRAIHVAVQRRLEHHVERADEQRDDDCRGQERQQRDTGAKRQRTAHQPSRYPTPRTVTIAASGATMRSLRRIRTTYCRGASWGIRLLRV